MILTEELVLRDLKRKGVVSKKVFSVKLEISVIALWCVRILWAFALFLVVRLFFTHGGIIEYYGKLGLLKEAKSELQQILKDNASLKKEITEMKSNSLIQKKLVRDYLGYIAQDEFLIIFPKNSNRSVASKEEVL